MEEKNTLEKIIEKKYTDLSKPYMYVNVEGKKVEDDGLAYTSLEVEMSVGDEASYCKFTVISVKTSCEDNKLTIPKELTEKFKPGNKVEVFLSYPKVNEESQKENEKEDLVFVGYITSINFEYTGKDDVAYTIEAMDLKVFMMNNSRSEAKKGMKKYSSVVTKILESYPSLYRDLNIPEEAPKENPKEDQTEKKTEVVDLLIEQHNQSDYDFIVSLAKKLDYKFFVCKGTVNFVKLEKTKETKSIIEISPSKYLYSIEREISLSKQIQSVTVRTNDEEDPSKPIEATANSLTTVDQVGESSISITEKLIGKKQEKTIIDNSVRSEGEAKARAQAELNRLAMDFVSGKCEIVGIPELEPGKFLGINGIESINGQYLITEVKHIFDDEGYRTICKFGASKI